MTFRYALLLLAARACLGQTAAELSDDATVRTAMEPARRNEPRTLDLQTRLCEIPAPPFQEAVRGQELQRLFQELGLRDVRIDAAGNVIGVRPGKAARPNLVFAAHLDTVFPEGTSVKVTREGDILKAPGIGDDCRGLAVMLAVIRALNDGHVARPAARPISRTLASPRSPASAEAFFGQTIQSVRPLRMPRARAGSSRPSAATDFTNARITSASRACCSNRTPGGSGASFAWNPSGA